MPPVNRESFLPPLWVLSLLAVLLCFWLVVELRELLVLMVVAYSIAYLIDPWVRWFESRKKSRSYGVLCFFVACIVVIALASVIAVPTLLEEFDVITDSIPEQLRALQESLKPKIVEYSRFLPASLRKSWFGPNFQDFAPIAVLVERAPAYLQTVVPKVFEALYQALLSGYSLTLTIANLILLPMMVYYISVDFPAMHRNLLLLLPPRMRHDASELALEINGYVAAFVRGQLMVGGILSILYMTGLGGFLSLKLWLLLALISGFGNIVPYLGTVVGVVLASLMAILTHGTISAVLWTWAVFAIVQTLEGFIITPKVVGESVGLSPLGVIVALFVAGQLFGLLGLFLAIPGTAVVRALGHRVHQWVLKRA